MSGSCSGRLLGSHPRGHPDKHGWVGEGQSWSETVTTLLSLSLVMAQRLRKLDFPGKDSEEHCAPGPDKNHFLRPGMAGEDTGKVRPQKSGASPEGSQCGLVCQGAAAGWQGQHFLLCSGKTAGFKSQENELSKPLLFGFFVL